MHRRPDHRVPGHRLWRAVRQAGAADRGSADRRLPAAGIHRKKSRFPALQDSRHVDRRRYRADEPVLARRAARADQPGSPGRRDERQRRPADDYHPPGQQDLRHRRHHRGQRSGGSDADRDGHRRYRRYDRFRRPVARHSPRQLHHLQRRQRGGERHSHRAGRALPADSQPHRRLPLQGPRGTAEPARRRHQPHQDHGLDGHQRAPPAARRSRPRFARRPQDRSARQHVSRQPRRENGDSRARHAQRLAQSARLGVCGRHTHAPAGGH